MESAGVNWTPAATPLIQLPGPTNVPAVVLEALGRPTVDHRGPGFNTLVRSVLEDLRQPFGTEEPVAIFPSSGTGGWEAALVNTLSPGDRVLIEETGFFGTKWADLAEGLGFEVMRIASDWRSAARPEALAAFLEGDRHRRIKAVLVVHNETSTGALSSIRRMRAALDDADHPALLLVDAVSSLATVPYLHDAWGVDVTITGSQKGLMLPPGLALLAVSPKARSASARARYPKSYWDWGPPLKANTTGQFPYTPATNMLRALRASLDLLAEEGLERVFERHDRHARTVVAACEKWGVEIVCRRPAERSKSLTAVLLEDRSDDRSMCDRLERSYGVSLGAGLGRWAGRCLRIGHLGGLSDAMLIGALGVIEIALPDFGVKLSPGGLGAALDQLRT